MIRSARAAMKSLWERTCWRPPTARLVTMTQRSGGDRQAARLDVRRARKRTRPSVCENAAERGSSRGHQFVALCLFSRHLDVPDQPHRSKGPDDPIAHVDLPPLEAVPR